MGLGSSERVQPFKCVNVKCQTDPNIHSQLECVWMEGKEYQANAYKQAADFSIPLYTIVVALDAVDETELFEILNTLIAM